ncbi:hypothetical protein [Oceanospirillum linum]|uniref:Uncharacterized protein n=1 Tax=Oceanospirillum linum TaxID=966 RepID=A0A1T1H8Z3_OCELI|nr:hypothetical protein [Oceanospirillum linum]OOV86200.1 hypothetical protein BTA35_0214570 [Oceanospirillum linum]SEG38358.1 hypothetical protein SAMN04489856_10968 [Oleiphilus messinensis]SMP32141.1 hypothetical protein SAMN06264348_10961 [Oceanospirillum linum]
MPNPSDRTQPTPAQVADYTLYSITLAARQLTDLFTGKAQERLPEITQADALILLARLDVIATQAAAIGERLDEARQSNKGGPRHA